MTRPSPLVVARRFARRRGQQPSAAERAAVNAYLFGFISREELERRIGRDRAAELAPQK